MKIVAFGNPDISIDSMPLKILPELCITFSWLAFETWDPNEEWNLPNDMLIVIDTIVGIKTVTVFHNLDAFVSAPRISLHNFDALTNLRLLHKLGKLPKTIIIGIPPTIAANQALAQTITILHSIAPSKNARHSSCKDHTRV